MQQKSPLAELFENETETLDNNFLEHEEYVFSWQEKVFGPFEVKFYQEEKNCTTDKHKEYHKRIKDREIQGSRLYSYIQADVYYSQNALKVNSYLDFLNFSFKNFPFRTYCL